MKIGQIKTREEIETLAEGGRLLHDILYATAALAKPGVSTLTLNTFAENEIAKIGGRPSFKNYGPKKNPFPAALCTSLNDEVVHGIPSEKVILKSGDIVGLDIGMEYKGLFTDTAITVPIGNVHSKAKSLIDTAHKALSQAIKQAKVGNRVGDISHAIQKTAEEMGFSVVRDLVGHGVGYDVHEDPVIPCYGKKGTGPLLKEGMVLAIEPMLCEYDYLLDFDPDGWTIRTKDKGLSAHFEHTIAITDYGARILT